eukprot:TRINITY_DN16175_c0_g1_i1.p1 TRINITY_DN16175_c0_g1~~TRINITY_DN16175_c0_g1_i1.p1  ORF type:complete len:173 (-),score=34.86 TRINITY_DN16175_c0_g1_i1:336-854(-)
MAQVGVELTNTQAHSLWNDTLGMAEKRNERRQRMTYEEALHTYEDVLSTPVEFRYGLGAAPPGELRPRVAEDPDLGKVTFGKASLTKQLPKEATRLGGCCSGLPPQQKSMTSSFELSLNEANDFLTAEGFTQTSVNALLEPFRAVGTIPQAAIFEYISSMSGASELSGSAGS